MQTTSNQAGLHTSSLLSDLWCILTGGTVYGIIGEPGNNCDYGNNWWHKIWESIKTIFSSNSNGNNDDDDGDPGVGGGDGGYGSDPSSPMGLWYGPGGYTGPAPSQGGGGGQGTSPASQAYQGGSFWVSRWVSDGCNVSGNGSDPNGSGGGPVGLPGEDGSNCDSGSSGHWESVEVASPDPAATDPNFDLPNYININNIDNNLDDVSVMPHYTDASSDDNIDFDFDPMVDANFVDVTLETSFSSNAQLNNIYSHLQTNATLQKILSKFLGKKNPISLVFRAQSIADPDTYGQTYPIGNSNNIYPNKIIIEIDPNKAANRPDLMVAKTIIHEVIHAEIWRVLHLGKLNILPTDYNKILNALLAYYNAYPKSNPKLNVTWDHGYMAQHYLSTIAKALKEFDNNTSVPLCFYKMLAWEGLKDTPYYNKMSSDNKQKVSTAISLYKASQTISPCIN